jgi:Zn-dependent protease
MLAWVDAYMQIDLEAQIFFFIVLILSIIIHEVAHGWAAYMLGDPTAKLSGRLTLNPLPHIDPIGSVLIPGMLVLTGSGFLFGWAKPVPYNPYNLKNQRWGEAIVGSAGVLTNLFLALLFAGVARAAFSSGMAEFGSLAAIVVLVNLSLGLLNLIPFPPLDGFRILVGVLPPQASLAVRDIEQKIAGGGFVTLLLLFFVFFYFLSAPFGALVYSIFGFLVG